MKEKIVFLCIILIAIFSVVISVKSSIEENKKWEEFKIIHECKIVGKTKSYTTTGVGYGMTVNGSMGTIITTNTIPAKTGWLCNDNVTYWK